MSIFDTEKVIAIEEHYIDPNVTKLQEESTKNTKNKKSENGGQNGRFWW